MSKPRKAARKTAPAHDKKPVWPWVLAGVLVLGLAIGAIAGLTGDGPTQGPLAQEPVVTTTPPTLPATLVPQIPQNLGQLIALLSADPTKYGGAGPELLQKLQDYEDKPDAARADDIVKRTNDWVSKGQLDAAFGATVIRIITGTTTAATPATQAPAPVVPAAGPKAKEPKGPKGAKGKGPKG